MQAASLDIRVDSSQVNKAKADLDELAKSGLSLETVVKKLAGAFAAYKISEYAKDAVMAALRYETLGIVMREVGKHANYTGQQMEAFARGLQKTGISMTESRNTLTQMTSAQMDLTKSAKLARIAQDAAVIGNINSSDAFQRMVHGIRSGETEVLRTIGINVQFDASYRKLAATLHKTVAELTDTEKRQARTNAVVEYGSRIAGAYEASMQTLGKQLLSAKRYMDDLAVSIGAVLAPIAKIVMVPLLGWLESASKNMKKFIESAEGQKFIDDIVNPLAAFAQVLGTVGGWIVKAIAWVLEWKKTLTVLGVFVAGALVAAFATLVAKIAVIGAASAGVVSTLALAAAYTVEALAAGELALATGILSTASATLGVSLGLVAAAAIAVGAAFVYALDALMGWSAETAKLEEQNRKMEEHQKKVNQPMLDQIDILKAQKKAHKEAQEILSNKGSVADKKLRTPAEIAAEAKADKEAREGRTAAEYADYKAREKRIKDGEKLAAADSAALAKRAEAEKKSAELSKRAAEEIRKSNIELEKERIHLTAGAMASERYELSKKGWGAAAIAHKQALSSANEAMKENHKLDLEILNIGARAIDVYKRQLNEQDKLTESDKRRLVAKKNMALAMEMMHKLDLQYLEDMKKQEIVLREIDPEKSFDAYQRVRDMADDGATANTAYIESQRKTIEHFKLQLKAAGLYEEALHKLALAELQTGARAGDVWKTMGAIVSNSAGMALDKLNAWTDNVDGAGRTWKTFGDTVKKVLADIMFQMSKAILMKQVFEPAMEKAGTFIGNIGKPAAEKATGTVAGAVSSVEGAGATTALTTFSTAVTTAAGSMTTFVASLAPATAATLTDTAATIASTAVTELADVATIATTAADTTSASTTMASTTADVTATSALAAFTAAVIAATTAETASAATEFFADGGTVSANKTIVVGEEGPELFTPSTAGTISTNGDMKKAAANSGGLASGGDAAAGSVTISVTVINGKDGGGSIAEDKTTGEGNKMAQSLRSVVVAEIQRQMRPGGVMYAHR